MIVYKSNEELSYRPLDGAAMALLRRGDYLRSPISNTPDTPMLKQALVGMHWAYHAPQTGVSYTLIVDVYLRFSCAADATRITTLHVQELMRNRQGIITRKCAYLGNTATLVQTWDATITAITYDILTRDNNPRLTDKDGMTWAAIKYLFTLTTPR